MTYAHAAALGGGHRSTGTVPAAELLGPHPDDKHQYGLVIDDIRCSELAYDVRPPVEERPRKAGSR